MRPFADLSGWNRPAAEIDWSQYVAWSAQGDGLARLVMKSSEGVGAKDKNFEGYWSRAVLEGVHILAPYHYARPDLQPGTSGAQQEARYFASVIGSRLRANDRLMLDLEQNESGAWAKAFGLELRQLLPRAPKPVLYDSLAHIQQFLQDAELPDIFDLAIAAWHDPAQGPPPVPAPWRAMLWWQFADNLNVPGVGVVDANLWEGPTMDAKYSFINNSQPGGYWKANGFFFYGWIAVNILALCDHEKLSTVVGVPEENQHHDSDHRWRQRFTFAIASQSDSDINDFRFEPLPSGDAAKLEAVKTWLKAAPAL